MRVRRPRLTCIVFLFLEIFVNSELKIILFSQPTDRHHEEVGSVMFSEYAGSVFFITSRGQNICS